MKPGGAETLAEACDLARHLQRILEDEFGVLGVPDLAEFEKIQPVKERILASLGEFVSNHAAGLADARPSPEAQSLWDDFEKVMSACRDAHRRNDILIRSKLEGIRVTLQVLQNSDTSAAVEVYDRLGRMSGLRRRRGYEDA